MKFWLCLDEKKVSGFEDKIYDGTKQTVNRDFNLSHGLEPMKDNVFKYVIEDILNTMTYGADDYLSVSYTPTRPDGIFAVQASRPQIDESFNVEIVLNDNSARGFKCYCKKGMTLQNTIAVFREVLVDYGCPDTIDWLDVTEIIHYGTYGTYGT